jgi:hypothetical protein
MMMMMMAGLPFAVSVKVLRSVRILSAEALSSFGSVMSVSVEELPGGKGSLVNISFHPFEVYEVPLDRDTPVTLFVSGSFEHVTSCNRSVPITGGAGNSSVSGFMTAFTLGAMYTVSDMRRAVINVSIFSSAVSALYGNPLVATQQGVLLSILPAARCLTSYANQVDEYENPTALVVGGSAKSPGGLYRGSVVSVFALLLAFGVGVCCFGLMQAAVLRLCAAQSPIQSGAVIESFLRLGFPSICLVPLYPFLVGSTMSSTTLLVQRVERIGTDEDSDLSLLLALVGLLFPLISALFIFLVTYVRIGVHRSQALSPRISSLDFERASPFMTFLASVMEPYGWRWNCRADAPHFSRSFSHFLIREGSTPWFLSVEMLTAVLHGAACGLRDSNGTLCMAQAVIVAALSGVSLLMFLTIRPLSSSLGNFCLLVSKSLTAAGAALAVLIAFQATPAASRRLHELELVTSAGSITLSALSVVQLFYGAVRVARWLWGATDPAPRSPRVLGSPEVPENALLKPPTLAIAEAEKEDAMMSLVYADQEEPATPLRRRFLQLQSSSGHGGTSTTAFRVVDTDTSRMLEELLLPHDYEPSIAVRRIDDANIQILQEVHF